MGIDFKNSLQEKKKTTLTKAPAQANNPVIKMEIEMNIKTLK